VSETNRIWRSKLKDHKRIGKELLPPFAAAGITTTQVFWWRDIMPEFLWIESLTRYYGEPAAVKVFNEFLTEADKFNDNTDEILDGTVTSFQLIPETQRQRFIDSIPAHVLSAVIRPFGAILGPYPECPMAWLVPKPFTEQNRAISTLRTSVGNLFDGHSDYAGFCLTLPIHRMFVHKRLFIVNTLTELIEAISKYPLGDRWRVESFARTT